MDKEDEVHTHTPHTPHTNTHTHTHTQEYCAAIKKPHEILPFAMTWMELEGVMLSISRSGKDH